MKIIGVTVGTPISVDKIKEKINPITSVNGVEADDQGNVDVQVSVPENKIQTAVNTALENAKESGEFDGNQGEPGKDGVSPTVSVEPISGGNRVTITDKNGSKQFNIMNGSDGSTGASGVSPTVSVAPISGGHRISITDANGTQTFDVKDGKDGEGGTGGTGGTGKDGVTFYPTVSADGTLSWTNNGDLTNPTPVNIKGVPGADGKDGSNGSPGANGVTFTPNVDSNGNLSWTNDGGLANPATVNIKGANGKDGTNGTNGKDGEDGVSVTHTWNGTTLTVTSKSGTSSADLKGDRGETGAQGQQGEKGATGDKGADGVGIKSVTQTTTSSADGGSNVITVTKTDNTTSTFTVKNGSKGSTGEKGADGKTPVKGEDYFTAADKQEMVQAVVDELGDAGGGTNVVMSETEPSGLSAGDDWDMVMTTPEAPKEMYPYNVTLTAGSGYTLTPVSGSTLPVYRGDSYSFTFAIADGYETTSGFAVKANGIALSAVNGVYTISNITADQTVTVEGVIASTATVTISGTGNSTYCYAKINNQTYSGTASGIEVARGSTITFGVYGRSSTYVGKVTIDGTAVLTVTNQTTQTYNWTVPAGTKTITMAMTYSSSSYSRYGTITVTTTK